MVQFALLYQINFKIKLHACPLGYSVDLFSVKFVHSTPIFSFTLGRNAIIIVCSGWLVIGSSKMFFFCAIVKIHEVNPALSNRKHASYLSTVLLDKHLQLPIC